MALNKNLSDDFFCEYFKWLFKKRKKKKTETQTLFLTRVFVCVCVCGNFYNGNSANFAFP